MSDEDPLAIKEDGFYEKLLENITDGVYFVDRQRRITFWNRGAEGISGFSRSSVVGAYCFDNILRHVDGEGRSLCTTGCPLAATIADGQEREMAVFLQHRDGHRVPVSVHAAPIRDAKGKIIGAVETFRDDTARAAALERAQQYEEMAYRDPLTRVGSRRLTEIVLAERVGELKRYGWSFAVLFIDIDQFKRINDAFGHEQGDRVIQMVARTLQGIARSHDFVGRWGGEEFVMVLVGVDNRGVRSVAERVRALVERSGIRSEQGGMEVTVSIGAAVATAEDSVEDLVRRADERMYRSKTEGRNRVTF